MRRGQRDTIACWIEALTGFISGSSPLLRASQRCVKAYNDMMRTAVTTEPGNNFPFISFGTASKFIIAVIRLWNGLTGLNVLRSRPYHQIKAYICLVPDWWENLALTSYLSHRPIVGDSAAWLIATIENCRSWFRWRSIWEGLKLFHCQRRMRVAWAINRNNHWRMGQATYYKGVLVLRKWAT